MINFRGLLAVVAALFLSTAVLAGDKAPEALSDRLKQLVPSMGPDSVKETPIKGIFEVVYGGDILYLTGDGKHLFQGSLVDLENHINLTEKAQNVKRKAVLDGIADDQTIMYTPKGETKHTITVFTDIDCPFCRKFHDEIDQYLALGIAVRYMLYPRSGYGTPSSDKLVAAWCAKDPAAALTAEKSGDTQPLKSCDNPVKEHLKIGKQVGVSGTPATLLESGRLVPGYRPAKDMAKMLDRLAAAKK